MVKKCLTFDRYFTKGIGDNSVYDMFEWKKHDIEIKDGDKLIFSQKGVSFPNRYSDLAAKTITSKYFFGEMDTSEREVSHKDLVGRVSEKFMEWGLSQKYFLSKKEAEAFRDDLAYLYLDQRMANNSPVWFNVGTDKYISESPDDKKDGWIISDKDQRIEYETEMGILKKNVKKGDAIPIPAGDGSFHPQTSACFINSVDDTMESIVDLSKREALLFRYGSGTGSNISTLRSSREKLSGGGIPSGPCAYLIFWDANAGIIKSGGKTRRAAKFIRLDVTHPDIKEFIELKSKEEGKIKTMMAAGYGYDEAIISANYQNTNISVGLTDDFMEAVKNNKKWKTIPIHNQNMASEMPEYGADELLTLMAKTTWACGDPGAQYHNTINKMNTCKKSGEIKSSNPCSEYFFLDNSSCNLASINLMKFLDTENETFDIDSFMKATRTTAIAQDLVYDGSGFPTKKIAENSHKFRPLGTGYSNLGSLLMSLGLPYDSDEARATAGAITALLTSQVYLTSTEMAEKIGTFEEYEKNKDSMMEVIETHANSLDSIDRDKIPKGLENVLDEANKTWKKVIKRGKKYGFRNAQATVLAPTGTISLMMDSATFGIEPEFGMVKTKKYAGGGIEKIVNKNVEPTLKKLGYLQDDINEILEYMQKNETMEGAPSIKDEHVSIFDCSGKPNHAKRTISYTGHLGMMAAVQPFLSGAISKTVNMPEEATIDDIKQTYIDAWEMGLKSVALYRQNSKGAQPLNFKEEGDLEKKVEQNGRRKLPADRKALTHKFQMGDVEGYLGIGYYPEGAPGEIFITMSKQGSLLKGITDAFATSISIGLQYGIPMEKYIRKMKGQKFDPSGLIFSDPHQNDPRIKTATSFIDYIGKKIELDIADNKETHSEKNISPKTTPLLVETEDEKKIRFKKDYTQIDENCINCGNNLFVTDHKGCEKLCTCGYHDTSGCGG